MLGPGVDLSLSPLPSRLWNFSHIARPCGVWISSVCDSALVTAPPSQGCVADSVKSAC